MPVFAHLLRFLLINSLDSMVEERSRQLDEFIKKTSGMAYKRRILMWFQQNLGKVVTSEELAQIPGRDGKPISHNIRRVFELRDEDGYDIANHKDNESRNLKLKIDEWVLLKHDPDPKKIRARGVNKRIRFDVFSRDNYICQFCGKTPADDDPFRPGHKIALHVGHIIAHKRKEGAHFVRVESLEETKAPQKLSADDFITMCNVCNEGAKNNDLKVMTLLDQVRAADKKTKREILEYLEKDKS